MPPGKAAEGFSAPVLVSRSRMPSPLGVPGSRDPPPGPRVGLHPLPRGGVLPQAFGGGSGLALAGSLGARPGGLPLGVEPTPDPLEDGVEQVGVLVHHQHVPPVAHRTLSPGPRGHGAVPSGAAPVREHALRRRRQQQQHLCFNYFSNGPIT